MGSYPKRRRVPKVALPPPPPASGRSSLAESQARRDYVVLHYFTLGESQVTIAAKLQITQPAVSQILKQFREENQAALIQAPKHAQVDYVLGLQQYRRKLDKAYERSVKTADTPELTEFAEAQTQADGTTRMVVKKAVKFTKARNYDVRAVREAISVTRMIAETQGVATASIRVEETGLSDTQVTMEQLSADQKEQALMDAIGELILIGRQQAALEAAQNRAGHVVHGDLMLPEGKVA